MKSLIVVLALALSLTGCASTTAVGGVDLEGEWTLTSASDADGSFTLVAAAPVTLSIDDDTGAGRAACNGYSVDFVRDGAGVRTDGASRTEMGCEPAIMDVESRYFAALELIDSAERTASELVFTGPDVELVFSAS